MKAEPAVLFAIAGGGALGALARFAAGRLSVALLGSAYPWGTLLVNATGCFLMGVFYFWLEARDATALKAFLMVGMLGAFTTFSAFALDAAQLLRDRSLGVAALYVGASLVLSFAGFAAGAVAGRAFG